MTVGPMLFMWEYEFTNEDSSPQISDKDPATEPPTGEYLP